MAEQVQLVTSYRRLLTAIEKKKKKHHINTNLPNVSDNSIKPDYRSSLKTDNDTERMRVSCFGW